MSEDLDRTDAYLRPKRFRLTVVYLKARKCWAVRLRKNRRGGISIATKAYAVSFARRLCRKHKRSQLVILKMDGKIQSEHTYGHDPKRSKEGLT